MDGIRQNKAPQRKFNDTQMQVVLKWSTKSLEKVLEKLIFYLKNPQSDRLRGKQDCQTMGILKKSSHTMNADQGPQIPPRRRKLPNPPNGPNHRRHIVLQQDLPFCNQTCFQYKQCEVCAKNYHSIHQPKISTRRNEHESKRLHHYAPRYSEYVPGVFNNLYASKTYMFPHKSVCLLN